MGCASSRDQSYFRVHSQPYSGRDRLIRNKQAISNKRIISAYSYVPSTLSFSSLHLSPLVVAVILVNYKEASYVDTLSDQDVSYVSRRSLSPTETHPHHRTKRLVDRESLVDDPAAQR